MLLYIALCVMIINDVLTIKQLLLIFFRGWVYQLVFFFFKQKTAYEMRISDWSSDVCSSDLIKALDESSHTLLEAAEAQQAAERGAEDALRQGEARHAQTGEALASAREARAGAVARAENQEQRRVEMGRISGERFECPAPLLPERLGFDSADEIGRAHV